MALTETARAKINLTLRVRGRRADGFHELDSLVAFAGFGDTLSLTPDEGVRLQLDGPFAVALNDSNLVQLAAERVRASRPLMQAGAFHLIKRIPVSAGLGGGSADAAAALRLLARTNPGVLEETELAAIAASLGADVPVCLASRTALVRGAGEKLMPLSTFPAVAVLLVNPGISLATGDVFPALRAPMIAEDKLEYGDAPAIGSVDDLIDFMRSTGNDLEAPATRLAPVIGAVKTAIAGTQGCLAAAMSGSGATCFGLYSNQDEALRAARSISSANPGWWTRATTLCGEPTED